MLYMNPKVARPDSRPHSRPKLCAGESLYLPAKPSPSLDGTTEETTDQDWRDLAASVGGWGEADGSNYNLDCTE